MAINEEASRAQYAAWNAWKDVCWVNGLGELLAADRPIIGTKAQAKLLTGIIANAFRRKLRAYNGCFGNEEHGELQLESRDLVSEFDAAINEYEICDQKGHEIWDRRHGEDNPKPRKPKFWKDLVWSKVKTSKDSPLQVIHGELLGSVGFINQVVTEWILKNYSVVRKSVRDPISGKKKIIFKFLKSRDAEVEKRIGQLDDSSDDGEIQADEALEATAEKSISPDCSVAEVELDERTVADGIENGSAEKLPQIPRAWKNALDSQLTAEHCCVIFADMMNIVTYNDAELLEALGCSKSTVDNRRKETVKIVSKLDPEFQEWLRLDAAGAKFMKKYVEKRALLEKAGQLILSRVKARDGHDAEGV